MTDPIPTGCSSLDDLLGGGFERGTVTQVYGPPASGKTNLALNAAVETAASGETAIYIDTEGLSVDRLEAVARGRAAGGRASTDGGPEPAGPEATRDAGTESVDDVASRIIITAVHDFEEQEEAVRDASDLASRAGVIVLDSATGYYRLERTEREEGEALRRVGRQVTHLLSLARKQDLAVVITNQVFTDPDGDRARPLGGHTLTHWSGVVLRLERFRGGNRRATLEKHRSRPAGETARFRITDAGLAGVEGR